MASGFLIWLSKRIEHPDGGGDLARTAAAATLDSPFVEVEGDGLGDARFYFERVGATAEILVALPDAWRSYEAERRPAHTEPVPDLQPDERLATRDEEAEAERLAAKFGTGPPITTGSAPRTIQPPSPSSRGAQRSMEAACGPPGPRLAPALRTLGGGGLTGAHRTPASTTALLTDPALERPIAP